MKFRHLNFQSLTAQNLRKVLTLSGHHTSIHGDEASVTHWLQTSNILFAASDAISEFPANQLPVLLQGFLWDNLPQHYWDNACEIAAQFQWEQITDDDTRLALQFARNVIRGDDSLEDTLGDPVLFVASLRGEFGVKGFRVAALLSAFSVLNTVFKCGGQFVWTRYSFHDKLLPLRERRVTWKNGLYYLPNNKWAKLNAYRRSKAHLSPARVLSSKQGTVRSSELVDMRPLAKDFTYPTTKNVAVAAMWLGVPVRELRLLVLLDLLYNEENDLSLYAEQEGVDLADILAVGGKTGVHSREGKIITVKDRILMYPSLKVTNTAGYTFHCGWGLTRAESTTSRANKCYSYHRTNFDRHARMWKTRVCETYVSKRTLFGSLISVFQLVCFSALVRMGELHHQFNSSDARSRLRNPGTFVETREAPSCYVPSAIELKLISAMRTLIHHGRNVSATMNNLEEHK